MARVDIYELGPVGSVVGAPPPWGHPPPPSPLLFSDPLVPG